MRAYCWYRDSKRMYLMSCPCPSPLGAYQTRASPFLDLPCFPHLPLTWSERHVRPPAWHSGGDKKPFAHFIVRRLWPKNRQHETTRKKIATKETRPPRMKIPLHTQKPFPPSHHIITSLCRRPSAHHQNHHQPPLAHVIRPWSLKYTERTHTTHQHPSAQAALPKANHAANFDPPQLLSFATSTKFIIAAVASSVAFSRRQTVDS